MRQRYACAIVGRVSNDPIALKVAALAPILMILIGSPATPFASAEPAPAGCPDVQAVFARGTYEPPGVGSVGQAFVDSLRSKLGSKSLDVYPVNYPASPDFPRAIDGVVDASAHIRQMATSCPSTKLVLGGYSQGAAVMGFVTADTVPTGVDAAAVPKPMDPAVADNVAAVALFGKPSERFMNVINEPNIAIGPVYAPKTIDLCVPNDPVCSQGADFGAHNEYIAIGMVDEAASYAAGRI